MVIKVQNIDYSKWADEYKTSSLKIKKRINELKKLVETEPMDADEQHDYNERISRLYTIYLEHRITARFLRERAERYKGDV